MVRRLIKDGSIPSYFIGRSPRVDADILEKWIVEESQKNSSEAP